MNHLRPTATTDVLIRKSLAQWLDELNQYRIDLGLERLKTVIQRLGLGQPDATVITVGGTNGKGSTVAMLEALLAQKGQRVGAFTSPHIHQFNERIVVGGEMVGDDEIIDAFETITKARAEIHLSYFEYAFLTALLIFESHQVDVMVLEVGLGGRLDATNAIDNDAAIITTVDYDHMEWLGDDLEQIATEKAGIMRSDRPVIFGDHQVPQSILTHAEEVEAKLLLNGVDFAVTERNQEITFHWQDEPLLQIKALPIMGDWQRLNLGSAVAALMALAHQFDSMEVNQALENIDLKGRMEVIQERPLVLADVAHNAQSARHLAGWLKSNPSEGVTRAVFSVLTDKQPEKWLNEFTGLVDQWLVFELTGERGMTTFDLKLALLEEANLMSVFDSASKAYQMAVDLSGPKDRVIVFGSFHVLQEVFGDES